MAGISCFVPESFRQAAKPVLLASACAANNLHLLPYVALELPPRAAFLEGNATPAKAPAMQTLLQVSAFRRPETGNFWIASWHV